MPNPSRVRFGVVPLALALVVAGIQPGEAAKRHDRPAAKTVAASETKPVAASVPDGKRPVSWTAGDGQARACSRIRRKLWQPGEGWVVKAVNICP